MTGAKWHCVGGANGRNGISRYFLYDKRWQVTHIVLTDNLETIRDRVSVETILRLLFSRRTFTHTLNNADNPWKPTWHLRTPSGCRWSDRKLGRGPETIKSVEKKQKHKSSCLSQTPLQHKFQDQTKTHRFLLGDCRLPSGHYQPWGCLSLNEIKISERCRDTFEQEARQPGNLICYKSIIAFEKAQRVLPHICITTDLKLLQFTAVRRHSQQQKQVSGGGATEPAMTNVCIRKSKRRN